MPGLTLGNTVPDLGAENTHGKMKLHGYFNDSWTVLFSHRGDFMPVCTTELSRTSSRVRDRCGVNLLGLSCDNVGSQQEWTEDVEAFAGNAKVIYLIIADPSSQLLKEMNVVDPDDDSSGMEIPFRALLVVDPDKKVRPSFLYPTCSGRNMDEVLRVLDSLQSACKNKVSTPVNWKLGDPADHDNEQAKELFPKGFKTVA